MLNALSLQLLDLFKFLTQVIHYPRSHIVTAELLLAHIAHTLHHLAQSHGTTTILAAYAFLHEPPESLLQIAVFQGIIRERIQDVIRVKPFETLPPGPSRVSIAITGKSV